MLNQPNKLGDYEKIAMHHGRKQFSQVFGYRDAVAIEKLENDFFDVLAVPPPPDIEKRLLLYIRFKVPGSQFPVLNKLFLGRV